MADGNHAEEYSYGLFRGVNHNGKLIPRELVDRGSVFISCNPQVPECIRYEVIEDAVIMLNEGLDATFVKTGNYAARLRKGDFRSFGAYCGTQINAEVVYDACTKCQGDRSRPGRAELSFLVNSSLVNNALAERN